MASRSGQSHLPAAVISSNPFLQALGRQLHSRHAGYQGYMPRWVMFSTTMSIELRALNIEHQTSKHQTWLSSPHTDARVRQPDPALASQSPETVISEEASTSSHSQPTSSFSPSTSTDDHHITGTCRSQQNLLVEIFSDVAAALSTLCRVPRASLVLESFVLSGNTNRAPIFPLC